VPSLRQVESHKPTSSPLPHDVFITHSLSPSFFSSRRRSTYIHIIPQSICTNLRPRLFVPAEVSPCGGGKQRISKNSSSNLLSLSPVRICILSVERKGAARFAFYYPFPSSLGQVGIESSQRTRKGRVQLSRTRPRATKPPFHRVLDFSIGASQPSPVCTNFNLAPPQLLLPH